MHDISDLENKLLNEVGLDFFDGPGKHIKLEQSIRNIDRCFGARISYEISVRYGEDGLPDTHSIEINLKGSAGQSFCAFLAKGVTVRLEGDGNDYVGKVYFQAITQDNF